MDKARATKGMRVTLNKAYFSSAGEYMRGRVGTIGYISQRGFYSHCASVLWDGNKKARLVAITFLDPAPTHKGE